MASFPQSPKSGPGSDPPQAQHSPGRSAQELQSTPEQKLRHSQSRNGPPLQQPELQAQQILQQPSSSASGPSLESIQPTIERIAPQDSSIPKPKNGGRKKIKIVHIDDDRSRQVTFLKRKNGILKKAHELSVLCGVDVHAIVFNNDNGKLYEYFNSSAPDTLLRYANFTGPRERRRSDLTDPQKPKVAISPRKGAEIPIEEPALANAATRAACMAAMRHAHPENYEHPAPHLKRIHPNVGVPAVQVSVNSMSGHPETSRNSAQARNSSQKDIIQPAAIPGSSHMHRSGAGPSNRPTPVDLPRSLQITPALTPSRFHGGTGSALSKPMRKSTPGPSRRPTPVNVPHAVYARGLQVPPARQRIAKFEQRQYGSTVARGLPVTNPLSFRLQEQGLSPCERSSQITACFGSASIERNGSLNHSDNGKPLKIVNRSKGNRETFEAALERQSVDAALPLLSHEPAVPFLSHVGHDLSILNGPSDADAALFNNVADGLDLFANNQSIKSSTIAVPSQGTPPSMMSPWIQSSNAARQSISHNAAVEPWNSHFFKEQMQYFESSHQDLPSLSPFLAELQQHAPDDVGNNYELLHEAAVDALSRPSHPASDSINTHSSASAGVKRRRDSFKSSDECKDSQRRRL